MSVIGVDSVIAVPVCKVSEIIRTSMTLSVSKVVAGPLINKVISEPVVVVTTQRGSQVVPTKPSESRCVLS